MRRRRIAATALVVAMLAAAACTSEDSQPATSSDATSATPSESSPPGVTSDDGTDATTSSPTSVDVTFATPDGETLAGVRFVPPGDAATGAGIVLAHMRGSGKEAWFDVAETLAAAGHLILAYDSRGYGDSTGARDTALDVDQRAAVAHLESLGVTSVVVVGASMNATAAVATAAVADLAGAVALSPPATFAGIDAVAAAADVDEPLAVVVAESDEPYATASREIVDATDGAAELTVVPGDDHGTALADSQRGLVVDTILALAAA